MTLDQGSIKAMVLAAGMGRRMRALTDNRPKPLLALRGRTMLDRALDHLARLGIPQVVINVHYLGQMIEDHLASRKETEIIISREEELLETGGGVKKALNHLQPDPFIVINADITWSDGPTPALQRLCQAWRDAEMDVLLLLQPAIQAIGHEGWAGDFMLDQEGRVRRRGEKEVAPYIYAGVQILHPRLFEAAPEGAFSLNLLYDKAAAEGRLWGLCHDGLWFHVGTPEALQACEDALHHQAQTAQTR